MRRELRVSATLLSVTIATAIILPGLATPQAKPGTGGPSDDAIIIRHLNAAIKWYKQLTSTNESAGEPSDAFYLDNARSLARQALLLAFQSAEAEAALQLAQKGEESPGAGPAPSTQPASDQQAIANSANKTANLISQAQSQIDDLNRQIAHASGKKLQDLNAKRESLQEQVDFNKTLEDTLQKLSTFMAGTAATSGGLQKEIDDLKNSVPELFAKIPEKKLATAPSSPPSNASDGTGLISQVSMLFTRLGGLRQVNDLLDGAAKVMNLARAVQSPLRTKLRATIQEGRGLAGQPAPQDKAGMEVNRQKIVSLTAQFKHLSNATIPLTQEIVLLQETQASLHQWESSVHWGYFHVLKAFLIRVGFLLIGIGIVVGLSELWRRATFRYVRDGRRRHQLLLVRRIVTAFLMAIVLALGFVSEFSSLATFAGFLTAGIAVALQTLILSIAAYFFLIGRHGIRVGDRITVANVTGDVIEVGMVRLYLMELGGPASDLHPTGRVVVVSNSVMLQGVPFFKQIPGAAYAWHEVAVKLEPGSNFGLAESKLLDAVTSVYSGYRDTLERQHQSLEGVGAVPFQVPSPQAHLQLVENVLELVVRYPVVLHRETEIDSQMTRKIMEVIGGDAELKAAAGSPSVRASVKP